MPVPWAGTLRQHERDRKLLLVFTSPEAFLRELAADQYGRMIREYGFARVVVDSLTQFESYPDSDRTCPRSL